MINIPDIINGLFELFGGPFILLSVIRIHKKKKVEGISLIHPFYFMLWGYWNLFYYPHLNQWCSFIGGLIIVIINTIWMIQLLYYSKKQESN